MNQVAQKWATTTPLHPAHCPCNNATQGRHMRHKSEFTCAAAYVAIKYVLNLLFVWFGVLFQETALRDIRLDKIISKYR